MKPYRAYKNPSLPWVGRIPAGWDALPNIALFDERIERGFSAAELLSVTQDRGIIKQAELEEKKDSSNEDKSAYKRVRVGDIAYNKMRMWQGAVGHSAFEGIVSPAYIVLKPKRSINPRYFHYLFRTPAYMRESYRNSYGICDDQLSLRFFNFKRMQSIIPPVEEQDAIVAFLEAKEQEVQTFIANKRRMIELLKEQKAALINRAVTRGLNPNTPLKPSGIPWLGQIPKHWKRVELRRVARFVTSGSRDWSQYFADSGALFIQSGNLGRSLALNLETKQHVRPPKGAEGERTLVRRDDVLVCVTGALTGNVVHVAEELEEAYINQHVSLVRLDERKLLPRFAAYNLWSKDGQTQFTTAQYGGTKQGLGLGDVLGTSLNVPPLDEQLLIVQHLDAISERTASAIAAAEREIALMKEYRTALIAAAVTGTFQVPAKS